MGAVKSGLKAGLRVGGELSKEGGGRWGGRALAVVAPSGGFAMLRSQSEPWLPICHVEEPIRASGFQLYWV